MVTYLVVDTGNWVSVDGNRDFGFRTAENKADGNWLVSLSYQGVQIYEGTVPSEKFAYQVLYRAMRALDIAEMSQSEIRELYKNQQKAMGTHSYTSAVPDFGEGSRIVKYNKHIHDWEVSSVAGRVKADDDIQIEFDGSLPNMPRGVRKSWSEE